MRREATILHADVDSFYASVEQRDDPSLRGRPVIVGAGVVLAASYEAKAYGVRTPMGGAQALRRCPHAVVVRPRMDAYSQASKALFQVFDDTTPFVEGLSIDEAFLDVGGLRRISGTPEEIAVRLRSDVLERVGLPVTVGVARTKFLAKVASGVAKPDALLVVPPDGELDFLHPLPVERLWGVGAVTAAKLHARSITTVAEVAAIGEAALVRILGRAAGRQHPRARSQSGSEACAGGAAPSLDGNPARPRPRAEIARRTRQRPRRADRPPLAEAPSGQPGVPDGRAPAALRRLLSCDPVGHDRGSDGAHGDAPSRRQGAGRIGDAADPAAWDHPHRRDVHEPQRRPRDPARAPARSSAGRRHARRGPRPVRVGGDHTGRAPRPDPRAVGAAASRLIARKAPSEGRLRDLGAVGAGVRRLLHPKLAWWGHGGNTLTSSDDVRVPPRYSRVNAWVISHDTDDEVQFLTSVFGAVETPGSRMLDPEGDIAHVEVDLGDSVIMLFDAKPDWPSTPAHLRIYVDDVDAAVERAVSAGARVVTRPTVLPFGESVARVRDPQGHLWWLHERVEDVSPDELAGRFADPAAQEAMAYVQRSLRDELAVGNSDRD